MSYIRLLMLKLNCSTLVLVECEIEKVNLK